MGVSRREIIEEAQKALGPTLNERGYFLDDTHRGDIEDLSEGHTAFSFEKNPVSSSEIYHTIEFRLSGFSEDDLFDMTVKLLRSTYRQTHMPPPPGGKMLFGGDLAFYFLDRKADPLPRWHFVTVEELLAEYSDILDRLLRYGIPLLENPNCGWDEWIGKKPIRQGEGYIIFDPPKVRKER